ncbi:3-alpha-hydroxysteroid dehydrogenase [Candidatus Promineifilum breve]|uniref:3-alpha-hydroxysteroid dehydrogenase n=1 Tax=Candidatus Promineifilum breve TaxID=1806508 RepID=A0A160T2D7_9CHLR|nr:SDR family oxidoreductase [Candidatus Promineifilum breve]CUS04271.2 3-alpha-hydroxysteroid dehydrogenase [Candidatus Promineifilum breve]
MHPIVVTGSQSGMGAAIASRLRGTGQTVIGVDLPGHGAEIEGDLSSVGGRRQIVAHVLETTGGVLGGLVGNAGVDNENVPLVLAVNYLGVVELLDGLHEALAAAGRAGVVVNVSNSIAVTPNVPQQPVDALLDNRFADAVACLGDQPRFAYQVSKTAVARWIRIQAARPRWAGRGITLNGICPGPVRTPLLEHDLQDPRKRDAILGLPRPLGDFTPPAAIADLTEFMLSERARFIVGQLIMIDGGIEATYRGADYPSPWIRPH